MMEYAVRIIEALAWPAAAIVIVFSFKSEIRKLLPQVTKLKAGPIEAEFERKLNAVFEEAQDILSPLEITQQVAQVDDKLMQLVKVDTRSAILEAWRCLEASIQEAIFYKADTPEIDVSNSLKTIGTAEKMQILPARELMITKDLRAIRNQAVHLADFKPGQDTAYKYIEMAKNIESKAKSVVQHGM